MICVKLGRNKISEIKPVKLLLSRFSFKKFYLDIFVFYFDKFVEKGFDKVE